MTKMVQRSDGSWISSSEILPKHQHKIMFCLAKNGAMNMSQTNRKIHGQNTSTTRAFHELKKKDLIKEVGTKNYHGRQFPEYWLTGRGLAYFLLNIHVASQTIENCASLYLKDKTIETYLKLRSVSESLANLLDHDLFRFGKIKHEEMAGYFVSIVNFYGKNEALKFLGVTTLPEEFYNELKCSLESTKKFLEMLEKIREN
jgi:hypothetical protein